MNKIKDHVILSKNIIKCKKCKRLIIIKYFNNILCEKCEKEYIDIINKIL
jgi:hypothetical protein